jgi:DNA repair protein RadC
MQSTLTPTLAPTTINGRYSLLDHDLIMTADDNRQYVLRVKDREDNDKPREKMLQLGVDNLKVAELVAVLWGVGTKKEEVMTMAHRLIKEYGEKALPNETNPQRLAKTLDIPVAKACQIVAAFELGRRYFSSQPGRSTYIRTAKQAHQYLQDMGNSQKEQLRGLYLNSRYQVIHDEVISVGTLTSNIVHPREVFQPALQKGAIAVIIAHNHPSGSLEPSQADIAVTQQLVDAGKILGIDLIDHLVIAGNRFTSVLECVDAE